ncbi:MAG: hypothetical protein P1V18_04040 [Candidatus Gracilibacteria bacterium]|nr:hypothetical protein [Candidatus Gracilibacteria bacterium]
MTDFKDVSVKALYQQSVLESAEVLQEQLLVQQQCQEDEVVTLQAKKDWIHQQMHYYKRLQEDFERDAKELEDVLNKNIVQLRGFEKKRLMIADLKAFACRERFVKDGQGACFFQLPLKDFAEKCGEGMVTIREMIPAAEVYGVFSLQDCHFSFLRTLDKALYFSDEVPPDFLES